MNSDVFLILFILFIAIMAISPLIFRKIKVPGVIALLIVGMIIGPNGLDLIRLVTRTFYFLGGDPEVAEKYFETFVNSLGALGLVFLMAQAGMEADFKMIQEAKRPVILLSILTFLIPALSGYFVYNYFKSEDFAGKLLYASLFASHSVGIVFPVIRELNLTKTKFGAAVLISTVVTDISSIILLAVSVQIRKQDIGAALGSTAKKTLSLFDYVDPSMFGQWFTPIFLLIVLAYLGVSVFVVYHLGKLLFKYFQPKEEAFLTILLLVILFTVLFGEFLGINLVVGAFIAGLALSRLVQDTSKSEVPILMKFESIGYGLLIPFLFISIGMKTDFKAFVNGGNILIVVLTVVGLVGSKILSGWLAMRLSGFKNIHGLCAGLMTVPQLSATLAAAAVGKDLGMLDNNFFNAIIVLSIVTTIPIPTTVRLLIEKYKVRFYRMKEEYEVPDVVKQDDLL